ncbi:uncharacterized protein B0I36DRAFT_316564 [Microdochium trichocladiopsis]|uniref:Uncharacterized protein n=1 Tax=Microdochium trichocladiopsis TaxID=1682393 RepID=A0A9P8Y7Y3_9PEZI|nr:uncharacterized protein B0I36DRAFT_316564 [Microdochium trichocladiopsis]KAH7034579.1 hypothetical protein B0I36DRAFT_316564 [Microdochium trichocladiopsis]
MKAQACASCRPSQDLCVCAGVGVSISRPERKRTWHMGASRPPSRGAPDDRTLYRSFGCRGQKSLGADVRACVPSRDFPKAAALQHPPCFCSKRSITSSTFSEQVRGNRKERACSVAPGQSILREMQQKLRFLSFLPRGASLLCGCRPRMAQWPALHSTAGERLGGLLASLAGSSGLALRLTTVLVPGKISEWWCHRSFPCAVSPVVVRNVSE